MKRTGVSEVQTKLPQKKKGRGWQVSGSMTVEMAGVMAAVLFTVMVLLQTAFRLRAETVGEFQIHEQVEQERHKMESIGEDTVSHEGGASWWSLKVTAPVFRPENSLRLWSIAE